MGNTNPASEYEKICREQGWSGESKLIHLEGFIQDKGLFDEFVAYCAAAAEEENRDGNLLADSQPG